MFLIHYGVTLHVFQIATATMMNNNDTFTASVSVKYSGRGACLNLNTKLLKYVSTVTIVNNPINDYKPLF